MTRSRSCSWASLRSPSPRPQRLSRWIIRCTARRPRAPPPTPSPAPVASPTPSRRAPAEPMDHGAMQDMVAPAEAPICAPERRGDGSLHSAPAPMEMSEPKGSDGSWRDASVRSRLSARACEHGPLHPEGRCRDGNQERRQRHRLAARGTPPRPRPQPTGMPTAYIPRQRWNIRATK